MGDLIRAKQNQMTELHDYTGEQVDLIKQTICKGATNDELKLFLYVCKKTGLDPFTKQIFSVARYNNQTGKYDRSVQTGIDGYRLIAERTGKYAGNDDPVFDDEENPKKATVTVYKVIGDQRCPFTASARWSQYYPGDKQGFMWKKMPHVMLGKCAEALALRKAFPAELSGLYTQEEMMQAERDERPEYEAKLAEIASAGVDEELEVNASYFDSGDPGAYMIVKGKFAKRRIREISPEQLNGYLDFIELQRSKGKPIAPEYEDLILNAKDYLENVLVEGTEL